MMTPVRVRKIVALVVLLSLLASVLYWWQLFNNGNQLRSETLAQASLRAQQLNGSLADQVALLLRQVDFSAQELAQAYVHDAPAAFNEQARQIEQRFPNGSLLQIGVIDAKGYLAYSNLGFQGQVFLGDRAHFKAHVDSPKTTLFISPPVLGRVSKQWTIQFSRPIVRNGRFEGVLVISLSPDYLHQSLAALSMSTGDSISILRQSGDYLARNVDHESALGKSVDPHRPFVGPDAAPAGHFKSVANFDQVVRLFHWQRLSDFPVVVVLGLSEATLLKPVDELLAKNRWQGVIATAILWLFTFGAVVLLLRLRAQQKLDIERANQLRLDEARLRAIYDVVPIGIVLTDRDGHIIDCNPASEKILGLSRLEQLTHTLSNRPLNALRPDGSPLPPEEYASVRTLKEGISVRDVEVQIETPQGNTWLQVNAMPIMADEFGVVVAYADITERKRMEKDREEALGRLQKIASRVPGVVFQFRLRADGSACVPYASEAVRELYRVSPEEVRDDAAPIFAAVHPDDVAQHLASITASAKHLTPWNNEYRLKFADGPDLWLLGNALPEREPDGSVLWHGFITNITERKQAEQQLRIAATAFEAQEGMVVTDANNRILRVNRAFTEITGYTAENVVGHNIGLLKSGRHDAAFYDGMWVSLQSTGSWQGEIWNRRRNGEVFPEWLTITAVKDAAAVITHYVATLTDITLRKAAEDEVRHLAFYDPLTLLPNRRLLLNRLQQALISSARTKHLGALLFIDLDNFKTLNDTLGHDVGDRLLQQVAQRLLSCVREGDTVARLGGDEFVVMLEGLSDTMREAAAQTETVGKKIIEALNQPYDLGAQPYHCTASIGATVFGDQPHSVDDLMKRADLAMYESKAAGRNTLRFFDPQMQADVTARAMLEADLRQALQNQELRLYYQCQVDETGRVTGAEALVRWQHPRRSLIFPADFIALAEETGLILPLGLWVLETACEQLVAWSKNPEHAHLSVAVNVSAMQFRQPDFVAQVLDVLQRSGANPHQLKLELTESLLLDNVEDIIIKMTVLKTRGIGFSLDDFGTGYSSLSYLKRLPLDQLKIDQTFVHDLQSDPHGAAIARTIVSLAQNLGLSVIAEGVETEAQRDSLAVQGCHAYQGYLFGRPLPLKAFNEFLRLSPLSQRA